MLSECTKLWLWVTSLVCSYLLTTAPYVPPPADLFRGGFWVVLLEEKGTFPCRISSKVQYMIERIKVARYITAAIRRMEENGLENQLNLWNCVSRIYDYSITSRGRTITSRGRTSFITTHSSSSGIFGAFDVQRLLLKQDSYHDQEEESCDRKYRTAFRN